MSNLQQQEPSPSEDLPLHLSVMWGGVAAICTLAEKAQEKLPEAHGPIDIACGILGVVALGLTIKGMWRGRI